MKKQWQFWIDRGGTFTDVVALDPENTLHTHKLLSENPEQYEDAALQGIRDLLKIDKEQAIPSEKIHSVKMGTTVATNALLEHKGEAMALVTTKGFADALEIGYQNRPQLFALNVKRPKLLYKRVVEAEERIDVDGNILKPVNTKHIKKELEAIFDDGIKAIAIIFMHGYKYSEHEQQVASIAKKIGFTQISTSQELPLMKLVSRGDTLTVDAYLSPILKRYIHRIEKELPHTRLYFMQSNGGLTSSENFHGKDSILSGPAGGIVGAAITAKAVNIDKLIGFDMGGTSTDVSHYCGEYERNNEMEVAGVLLRAPMMNIHTIAAGGGSIVDFRQGRYRVGPESAGANPGPACYRRGGPLTVTDCNVLLGRIQGHKFPKVFGLEANEALDSDIVKQKFSELIQKTQITTGDKRSIEAAAEGFLKVAVQNMANAIKKISVQRGYDVTEYTLCSFGGASGQHACLVADALGIKKIFIHPFAGILSAFGMGLADLRIVKQQSITKILSKALIPELEQMFNPLMEQGLKEMENQDVATAHIEIYKKIFVRYEGTDVPIEVNYGDMNDITEEFSQKYQQYYGFLMQDKALVVESLSVEVIGKTGIDTLTTDIQAKEEKPEQVSVFIQGQWQQVPLHDREALKPGDFVKGPALIIDKTSTHVIEPGWQCQLHTEGHLICERYEALRTKEKVSTKVDPVLLEVFNNLYMSIAEQMGTALANTAYSVNIKERLDFSCALFDEEGHLIANAPHVPVHLGSMSASVKIIKQERAGAMQPGDVFMLNNPYHGGTHLPDVTVITPVFIEHEKDPTFFVASRAHHADIGGITPGSVPPMSKHVNEEGVLIDNFQLVQTGKFLEKELRELFLAEPYPVRNITQNIADLKAQIAANKKGEIELKKMVSHFGKDVVAAYMQHVQDNAAFCVEEVLDKLNDGEFSYAMDNGAEIKVKVSIDKVAKRATIDFAGTSEQQHNNFNAPTSVCRAAILYVFRTLIDADIPLNQGFFRPLNIVIPENCMLNPKYPAAVVAGNVETSQCIVDSLYGALGIMGASQGTMNNFTYGNKKYQNYETICGGTGAGNGFDGTDAIHSHMTNTRMTDPEVLELRFPIIVEEFSIRKSSGGKGRWHGGNGVIRVLKFLEPMTGAILSNRRKIAPYGMAGGAPGQLGTNKIIRADGREEILGSSVTFEIKAGDTFVIETPGGGGFG